jgi:hypothetical protein
MRIVTCGMRIISRPVALLNIVIELERVVVMRTN